MESLIQDTLPDLDLCIKDYIVGILGDENTVEEIST